jgi:hypothetical protein
MNDPVNSTNPKKPLSMASRLQRCIAKTEAISGSVEVRIVFTDESDLSFQAVSGQTIPVVNGEAGSMAKEFAAGTNKYTFLAAGVQMTFKDGSSCNMNFGRPIDGKVMA